MTRSWRLIGHFCCFWGISDVFLSIYLLQRCFQILEFLHNSTHGDNIPAGDHEDNLYRLTSDCSSSAFVLSRIYLHHQRFLFVLLRSSFCSNLEYWSPNSSPWQLVEYFNSCGLADMIIVRIKSSRKRVTGQVFQSWNLDRWLDRLFWIAAFQTGRHNRFVFLKTCFFLKILFSLPVWKSAPKKACPVICQDFKIVTGKAVPYRFCLRQFIEASYCIDSIPYPKLASL